MLFYSTAVQLVLLAATVTAFQPASIHTTCAINRRHHHASQTKPICTIHAAAKGFANKKEEEEEQLELEIPDDPELDNLLSVYARLNEVLSERREELLLDASQLQKQCPLSTIEADNQLRASNSINITIEEKVREALLSSRLPLPFLNKSRLGPSLIEGAGRGLFATEDLTEGEVITCYPGDALMYEMPVDVEDENDDESNDDHDHDHGEEDYVEEMVLWGVHVPETNIWSEDVVFDGDEETNTPPLTTYGVSIDDQYSVMGHPALDDNPAYFGHFVNDGAGHLALEKPNSESNIAAALELGLDTSGGYSSDDDEEDDDDHDDIGVEENIAAYVLKSIEVANAMHRPLDEKESHMVTVATRDIKKGEEILVTYGPDYWAGYA